MRHPLRRLRRDLDSALHDIQPGDGTAPPDEARVRRASRSITELYGVMAVGVAIWVVYLAVALPERNTSLHYDVTWVGFDLFLVAAMAATAYLAYLVDPAVQLTANATATLLIVDAWFDITTSSSQGALLTAIAFAVVLELPLAGLSLRISRNVHRAVAARARASGPFLPPEGSPSPVPSDET